MKKVLLIIIFYLLFPKSVFAQTMPPIDKVDSLSFFIYNGKLREVVVRDDVVWWRESTDQSEKNLTNNWSSKLLSEAWPPSVSPAEHPLPFSGLDVQKYQQFNGCGSYGNYVTEIVVKGGNLWYRHSSDISGSDIGSKPFIYSTLAQSWGTSGPPTDFVDDINYDIYDNKPRELVIKGNNVWIRTLDCNLSQWGNWTMISLSQAWGTTLNPPPTTGGLDIYSTDYVASDKSLEIVVQGNTVWSRRSSDNNTHHVSDVWRQSTLNSLWQRYQGWKTTTEIAQEFINSFLSTYGGTDFEQVINYQYLQNNVLDTGENNFRALAAEALSFAVRYRLNNNSNASDLQKAKYFINASLDHYDQWGKYHHLSGECVRGLLLSSWILWDTLTDQEKLKLHDVARQEANFWTAKLEEAKTGGPFFNQINGWIDDTKAETNGAFAEGLAFAAILFPDDPSASSWEKAARCFAFHTATTSQASAESRGGTSTYCGITTQTLYDDFTLDNHNYHPSVLYTLAAIAPLDQAGLGYYLGGYSVPWEFKHNTAPLWNKFLTYFHHGDYTIFPQYFRGQDWGDIDVWLSMTDFNYISLIDNSSQISISETDPIAWDIIHYFYSIKGNNLRFPVTNPVTQMPATGQVATDWFLNSLISAKGSAEIIIYSNPKFFFCRGNIDILGKSTHLCNSSIPLKQFPSSLSGDLNNDGNVDTVDFHQLLGIFINIFDYNKLVGSFGQ